MFKGLVSLTKLIIQFFKSLHVIECGAFKHLSDTLVYLDVAKNSIKTIESGAFKYLRNLKYLSLVSDLFTTEQLANLKIAGELPPLLEN
jgi:Leucine-rich repeat (LRR) protein